MRLPSSIYWSGLAAWGIRLYQGSEDQYRRSLDPFYRQQRQMLKGEDQEPLYDLAPENWHGLPEPPPNWPNNASLTLRPAEAQYLKERILDKHAGRLLAYMVDRDLLTPATYAWELPYLHELPASLQADLQHARRFSEAMYGASLLYNLLLARLQGNPEWIDTYERLFTDWAALITDRRADFRAWHRDLTQFWTSAALKDAKIPGRTVNFVEAWLDLALDTPNLADSPAAVDLLTEREIRLKGSRAKLANERARELWLGATGAYQLSFRWPVGSRLVKDILAGLRSEEDSHA